MARTVSIKGISAVNNNQIGLGFAFKPKFFRGVKSSSYIAKESSRAGEVSTDTVPGPKMEVSALRGVEGSGKLRLKKGNGTQSIIGGPGRKRPQGKKRRKATSKRKKRTAVSSPDGKKRFTKTKSRTKKTPNQKRRKVKVKKSSKHRKSSMVTGIKGKPHPKKVTDIFSS